MKNLNITYIFTHTLYRIVFLFLFLITLGTITAQTKSISLVGNYPKTHYPSLTSNNEHINTDSLVQYLTTSDLKTYAWQIDKDNSWEDLKNSLPGLKIAGISINVSIMAPSNNSPSQPFGFNFITWAKEIANLSLRYSNLKGYSIKDFQENVNLNNFNQTYIDNMDSAGKQTNPKLQFINAGKLHHTYYVDKNATGNRSGLNWTNAATSLSAVFTANPTIGNGINDTIYISGGTDSTIYMRDILNSKTPTHQVIITKGIDAGHNGVVCYEPPSSTTHNCLQLTNCINIKITDISIFYNKNSANAGYGALGLTSCSYITIDNCDIRSNGQLDGVLVWYSSHISFTNNYIHTDINNYANGQDAVWIGGGKGGHTITGNKIILRGTNATPHIDGIQMYQEGGTGLVTTIANNLIKSTFQVIFTEDMRSNRFLIYNNILVDSNFNSGNAIISANNNATSDTTNLSYQIYSNTLIGLGDFASTDVMLTAGHIDSLIFKNNIGYFQNGGRSLLYFASGLYSISFLDIDYNRYYQGSSTYSNTGRVDTTEFTSGITFSKWQGLGHDIHSDMGIVTFANIWGTNIFDYRLTGSSGCIDTGTPIILFNRDIEGTFRPQGGAWDKGAFDQ